jgi:hypothetical protein
MEPFIGYVIPLGGGGAGGGRPVDPGWGIPAPPPLPGHDLPGGPPGIIGGLPHPAHPIFIPDPPDGATKPPPEVYPPLPPPDAGGPSGPGLILVWIPGVGYRWIHLGPSVSPTPPPTRPQPKT